MTNDSKLWIGVGLLAAAYWFSRKSSGKASILPTTIEAPHNSFVTEDDTGEALRDLILKLEGDPARSEERMSLSVETPTLDFHFSSSPTPYLTRKGIGGQPGLLIP